MNTQTDNGSSFSQTLDWAKSNNSGSRTVKKKGSNSNILIYTAIGVVAIIVLIIIINMFSKKSPTGATINQMQNPANQSSVQQITPPEVAQTVQKTIPTVSTSTISTPVVQYIDKDTGLPISADEIKAGIYERINS